MGRPKTVLRIGPAETLADQRSRILELTQEQMCRRLDCSQGYLSLVECSKAAPTHLRKWAREYRLSQKRFKALSENQFALPLWRFATQEEAGMVESSMPCESRKAEAV